MTLEIPLGIAADQCPGGFVMRLFSARGLLLLEQHLDPAGDVEGQAVIAAIVTEGCPDGIISLAYDGDDGRLIDVDLLVEPTRRPD